MNKIDLGQAIGILANLGVIAGIAFLAIEISQNTAMMEAQMDQGRAELAAANSQAVFNSDYLPEILVHIDEGRVLSAEQMYRYRAYLRNFHRVQDNYLSQIQRGLLDQDVEAAIRGAVRSNVVGNNIALDLWEAVRWAYSPEYRELVDAVIDE
jgi:hypothetical protein